jgi:chromosome segregation ATPase
LFVEALLAPAVMVSYMANTRDWRQIAHDQQREAQLAGAQASQMRLVAAQRANQLQSARQERQATVEKYENRLAELRNERDKLTRDLAAAEGRYQQLQASLDALEAGLNREITLRETMKQELDKLRTRYSEASDQLRQAQVLLDERTAENERLTKSVQVLREQARQAADEAEELRQRLEDLMAGRGAVADGQVTPVPANKIEATVTAVRDDIAALNVGQASGVKEGMEFILYRGAQYVAKLQIAHVDASSSSGIIVQADRDVRQGDKATTSLDE